MSRPIAGNRRTASIAGLCLAACLALGCDNSPPLPRAASPEEARKVLIDVLDHWKGGKKADELAAATPPILVVDDDWAAGLRLSAYRREGEARVVGTSVRCPVELSLIDRKGKAIKRRVVYQVGTDPTATVIRHDEP